MLWFGFLRIDIRAFAIFGLQGDDDRTNSLEALAAILRSPNLQYDCRSFMDSSVSDDDLPAAWHGLVMAPCFLLQLRPWICPHSLSSPQILRLLVVRRLTRSCYRLSSDMGPRTVVFFANFFTILCIWCPTVEA